MSHEIRRVAIFPWGNVIEDFLGTLGVSLDEFCQSMMGSWMFSYALALRTAGVESTFVVISGEAKGPEIRHHVPTDSPVLVIPAGVGYRLGRALARSSFRFRTPRGPGEGSPSIEGGREPRALDPRGMLRGLAAYLSTPGGRLWRALAEHGCDAVLCQEYEYARFDVLAIGARARAIPLYASFQGGDRSPYWPFARHLRRWAVAQAAGLIVGPAAEAARVANEYQLLPGRLGRIPNPVELPKSVPDSRITIRDRLEIPPHAPVVVWHGRVDIRTKGLDILLDAWRQLHRDFGPDAIDRPRLLLVGTGQDSPRLRDGLSGDEFSDVTWIDRFVHDRGDMFDLLAAGDVYAFPSRREGFPVAPVEAMGCGLPVVAAEASGVREIFPDGERSGGILVPVDDSGALARELSRLVQDPGLARRVGEAARRRAVSAFSLECVGERLAAFLEDNAGATRG